MGVAFGLLRLNPDAFWRMTPIEFNAALESLGLTQGVAPQRSELHRLMQLFPDSDNLERTNGR